MKTGRRPIKGLGEIALRVEDLDSMQLFYDQVVGLELIKRFEGAAFLKLGDGHGGHTQVLALFDRKGQAGYAGLEPLKTTVDHIAFEIDLADFAAEKHRLEQLRLVVTTAEHGWAHWRSLYICDPEGHSVEFVCFNSTVQ